MGRDNQDERVSSSVTRLTIRHAVPRDTLPGRHLSSSLRRGVDQLTERKIIVLRAWLRCDYEAGVALHRHIALGLNTHLARIRDPAPRRRNRSCQE